MSIFDCPHVFTFLTYILYAHTIHVHMLVYVYVHVHVYTYMSHAYM